MKTGAMFAALAVAAGFAATAETRHILDDKAFRADCEARKARKEKVYDVFVYPEATGREKTGGTGPAVEMVWLQKEPQNSPARPWAL